MPSQRDALENEFIRIGLASHEGELPIYNKWKAASYKVHKHTKHALDASRTSFLLSV